MKQAPGGDARCFFLASTTPVRRSPAAIKRRHPRCCDISTERANSIRWKGSLDGGVLVHQVLRGNARRVGKARVMSQQATSIAAEPLSDSSRPPHWYSRPDSKVPMKRPSALAA